VSRAEWAPDDEECRSGSLNAPEIFDGKTRPIRTEIGQGCPTRVLNFILNHVWQAITTMAERKKMNTQLDVAGRLVVGSASWGSTEAWVATQQAEAISMLQPAAGESESVKSPAQAILHRATAMTSVMDRILQQANPPSHWGINE
jgi:hypothetical protein